MIGSTSETQEERDQGRVDLEAEIGRKNWRAMLQVVNQQQADIAALKGAMALLERQLAEHARAVAELRAELAGVRAVVVNNGGPTSRG